MATYPSFSGLSPGSAASSVAKKSNRAKDTAPELLLRRCLWKRGLRYRVHYNAVPGKPDLVFTGPPLAVFCDGDFWHGRNWKTQKVKLAAGHNADYWVKKIEANLARDRAVDSELQRLGWKSLRVWETEIKAEVDLIADRIERVVRG